MSRTLEYVEVWSDYPAAGGTRETFLPCPAVASDDLGVDGRSGATVAYPKGLTKRAVLARGKVLRFRGSETREWEIRQVEVASGGGDPLITCDLIGPEDRLRRVPVRLVDGDGIVYHDVPFVGIAPADVLDAILDDAPSWFAADAVTPTDRVDVQLSGASALSAAHTLAALTAVEVELERDGIAGYDVHLRRIGATAPTVRLRTGKNLVAVRRAIGGEQVTRALRIRGADTDSGPATIGWAKWAVVNVAGSDVTLGPIHGAGAGPVGFDDQYNHAHLGFTAYLQRANGTFTAISDSVAATQVVTVADATGITIGDRVRIVASSTGEHLAQLDVPAAIAVDGIQTGDFTSELDDTENILGNPLALTYTNPSARPDGWGGSVGTWTRESDAQYRLTGDYSAKGVFTSAGAGTAALTVSRAHFVSARRSTFSLTLWLRVTAIATGQLGVRMTVGGTPVGEMLTYRSPINGWVQLKIEGLDLHQHIGTVQTIGFALYPVPDSAVMNATFYVDSVQVSPTPTARAITHGCNAARMVQQVNAWLHEKAPTPIVYTIGARDLARAGVNPNVPLTVGGGAVVDDDELGVSNLAARLVRRRRDLIRDLLTEIQVTTAPAPRPGRVGSLTPITIPFFEPVDVRQPTRDARQARQTLTSKITATGKDTVTITLYHSDLLGGTPTIVNEGLSGATYASGSGLGPYVFNRPAAGAGPGGAHFTAKIPGRTDVATSVEVPAQDLEVGSITGTVAAKSGSADLRLEGSASTASWRYAVSTSSMPADATVDGATAQNGRSITVTGAATLALDQTLYVKARAYSGGSGGGQPAAGYVTFTLRRDSFQATKTIRFPWSQFVPSDETQSWLSGAHYLAPNVASAEQSYMITVVLPKGVTITSVSWRWRRGGTGDVVRLSFLRTDDSGSTSLASFNPVSGTGVNTSTASVSQLVGNETYVSSVRLEGTAPTSCYFLWMEITYTMPDPDKAY